MLLTLSLVAVWTLASIICVALCLAASRIDREIALDAELGEVPAGLFPPSRAGTSTT